MTSVLFCVIAERGHVNPYIGPAQALRAAGADVTFWAPADISAQLTAAGLSGFVGSPHTPAAAHRGALFAERVRDAAWLRQWIKQLLVESAALDVEPIRSVLRRVAPDVVALDPMIYAGAIACELEGIPWAAVSNSLNPALPDDLDSELLRTVAWLAEDRRSLFAHYGLSPSFRGCDVLSPQLSIAFTTEDLVGHVPGVELVGPSLPRGRRGDEPDFPWSWLDPARPLLYASFGSQIGHQPVLFRALVEAVRGRPLQLVLSAADLAGGAEAGAEGGAELGARGGAELGARGGAELGALPDNVLARSYVPQLALLERAAAFVTHGGANSVIEAIAAGVPMVVVPLCNDQFHQAHFVTRAGIGRTLESGLGSGVRSGLGILGSSTHHRDSEAAWDAVSPLLDDGPERLHMKVVSASYRRDGAAACARLLIELGAKSPPERGS